MFSEFQGVIHQSLMFWEELKNLIPEVVLPALWVSSRGVGMRRGETMHLVSVQSCQRCSHN